MTAPGSESPRSTPGAASENAPASSRKSAVAVLAAIAFFFLLPAGWRTLWSPDEGRYAEIPREMVQSGDWVTPRLNGIKYFEKPPLVYWLEAATISVFGMSERALRTVPALFGLLGAAATYSAARRLWGQRAAVLSALVLATMPLYFSVADLLAIDMAVSALITVTLLSFLAAVEASGRRRDLALAIFYASAALATLAKGLIGIAIPGLVIVLWLALTSRWRELRRLRLVPGTLLFLALAAPWHLLVQLRNPEWAAFYFIHEQFLRFTTTIHRREEPFWFYVPILVFGLLPWSALAPAALSRWWRDRALSSRSPQWEAGLFCVLWAGVVVGFFSLSGSKLATYVVPALPPLALLIGAELAREARLRWAEAWVIAGTCTVLAAALALAPGFAAERAGLRLAIEHAGLWRWLLAASLVGIGAASILAWRLPRRGLGIAAATAGALLVLAGAATTYNHERSVESLARVLAPRLAAGDLVASYRCYPQDLAPYLGRRIATVDWLGELEFGASVEDQSAWLLNRATFEQRWNGPGIVYSVSRTEVYPELERASANPPTVLARTHGYVLAVNHPQAPPR